MAPPNTIESLARDLVALGVRPGMTLMVHSSLSQVGWTVGGPVALLRALLEALGAEGTLVTPAETPQLLDPAMIADSRVDPAWYGTIREAMPVFDPLTTPTTLGAVPEAARTYPGTLRSKHPLVSVCANGPLALAITREHSLAFGEGRGTPFEKLYELDAHTLLLGVGFDRCTSLHYAESLVPSRRTTLHRYPIERDGRRTWVEMPDMATDGGVHFPAVGQRFRDSGGVADGRIGCAEALLFSTRELVDFAEDYFREVLAVSSDRITRD